MVLHVLVSLCIENTTVPDRDQLGSQNENNLEQSQSKSMMDIYIR